MSAPHRPSALGASKGSLKGSGPLGLVFRFRDVSGVGLYGFEGGLSFVFARLHHVHEDLAYGFTCHGLMDVSVLSSSGKKHLGIQKPTVLGVRPSNYGVITYYFVGFGVTGSASFCP